MKRTWFFTLLIALPGPSSAQFVIGVRDSLAQRVDHVFAAFDRTNGPGCAVGVYRDGRVLYARGYGMANLELGTAITPRTAFNIGSVTKMFTASAVVLLALDGKLSLDDPISKYFPEMPPYASGIKVRQLLNHTAGLREYFRLIRLAGISSNLGGPPDFVRLITRSTNTNFPPGTRTEYSNSAYVLAGELVARVSGRSLGTFLEERIFDPLGMNDTHLMENHRVPIPGRAQGYDERSHMILWAIDRGGDGGLWTTVEDLARWDHNWQTGAVGGRALTDSLKVRVMLRNDSTIGAGLGGSFSLHRGLWYYTKDGVEGGFTATYGRFVDEKLGVATLCNLDVATDPLTRQVAAVYLGARMTPVAAVANDAWETALLAAPEAAVSADRLRRLESWWRDEDRGVTLSTRTDADRLVIEPGSQLVPLGGDRFRFSGPRELVFENNGTDVPRRMRVRARTFTWVFERRDIVRLSSAQLPEYAGEYHSAEIEATYTLTADSSGLVIRLGGRRLGRLEPTWRDAFVLGSTGYTPPSILPQIPGAGLGDGSYFFEFTRDARGRINGFAINDRAGTRIRNLQFVRRS